MAINVELIAAMFAGLAGLLAAWRETQVHASTRERLATLEARVNALEAK